MAQLKPTKRSLLEELAEDVAEIRKTLIPAINTKLDALIAAVATLGTGVTMANQALEQIITQVNDATNQVATRLDALETQLQGVATQDQLDELSAIKTHLQALGADPSNPVPPPPPVGGGSTGDPGSGSGTPTGGSGT
jgi:ABC-type transporter Mla subunit MlaD